MKVSRTLVFLGLLAIAGHACAEVVSEPADGSAIATPLRKLNNYGGGVAAAQSSAVAAGDFAFASAQAVAAAGGGGGAAFASSSASAGSLGGYSKASSSATAIASGGYKHPRNRYFYRCYWTKNGCGNYHGNRYNYYPGGRKMLGGSYYGGGYAKASAYASAGSYYQPYYGKGKGGHYGKSHYKPRRWNKHYYVPKVHFGKYIPQFSWNKGH